MSALEGAIAFALNHILEDEAWARRRLAPFAGETFELRAPPLPALRFTIAPEGRVQTADSLAQAALVVTLGPESAAAAMRGEDHFMRSLHLAGNAQLASELLMLARHLRWDAEEDLAALVGDVAAHRLAGLGRELLAAPLELVRRLGAGAAEYASGEGRLLVTRAEFSGHAAQTACLRDGIERLESRLRRLG